MALKYLSEAEKTGFYRGWQDYILIYPPFENLWDDPEFQTIVNRSQKEKAILRSKVRELEENGELDLSP